MPDEPHGPDLSALTTESIDDRHADLDTLSTRELAVAMNAADAAVTDAVEAQLDAIVAVVEGVTERLRRGGRLVYAGAGTAGRLGVLDASECPPTFDTDPSLVVGLIATLVLGTAMEETTMLVLMTPVLAPVVAPRPERGQGGAADRA